MSRRPMLKSMILPATPPRLEVEIEHLPNRVVQALLHGEYAALVSRDFSMRAQYFAEIASLHTRDDLLSQDKRRCHGIRASVA
jgi:hypothetical protein